MKIPFFLFSIGLGIVLAVHLAMNGKVGAIMENPRVANAVFWCIGAVAAIIVGITGFKSGALAPLKDVPPILLTAGALGALLVFAIAWSIPQVGASAMFISLLAGQVLGAMLMSHFGWLGSPQEPITWLKLVGALIMIQGAVLVVFSD